MRKYEVTGMSCAACSTRVEKAVQGVPGVKSCSVSLLTNSMSVEGEAGEDAIINAVEKAGYKIRPMDTDSNKENRTKAEKEEALKDKETPALKRRLFSSLGFMMALMYVSMGHVMWGWPVPEYFSKNPAALGLLQLILTTIILIINQKFFINGFKGLLHGAPNMDTLVALGAGASMIYSIYALFAMTEEMVKGDMMAAHHYLHEFYFESAAMIVTLITVGKMLEARAKGKTSDALKGLLDLAPKKAVILENGTEKEIPAMEVKKGDVFVVRPGESVPVDGVVKEGYSAIDESALTGESIPVDKEAGDMVYGATINKSGFLTCEAVKVGEDTTLSQIISLMSDVAATKAPIAKIADRVSGVFVPIVIVIALVTIAAWLIAGESAGFALARGISVLVISCPCALGLATPVAIMVGNGMGARNGILFKTAASLEEAGKTEIVVLDKTGTITKGEPQVTDIIALEGTAEKELLQKAYSLEKKSEHPLAKSIVAYGENEKIEAGEVSDFQVLPGNGLRGRIEGKEIHGGSLKFILSKIKNSPSIEEMTDKLSGEGKTPLFFMEEDRLLGIIAVADSMKEDSRQAIEELKNMGIYVVMLTGDNEKTAGAIGSQAGVDEVIAGVLPDGKEKVISSLQQKGKVAMVGDGINDALALTKAHTGIAIGAGTDIAIDAADVVLMKSKLSDVPAAIRLSRQTKKNIHENLFWAFAYNVIGIPLAAGIWIPVFGLKLNPMFGALAMSLSSFCVVTNALRLNLFDIRSTKGDRKRRGKACDKEEKEITETSTKACDKEEKEITETSTKGCKDVRKEHLCDKGAIIKQEERKKKTMKKKIIIEGMMCGHCEAAVKKALEALPQVEEAVVSHETGSALVTLKEALADELLKKTIEDKDYKVIGIEEVI